MIGQWIIPTFLLCTYDIYPVVNTMAVVYYRMPYSLSSLTATGLTCIALPTPSVPAPHCPENAEHLWHMRLAVAAVAHLITWWSCVVLIQRHSASEITSLEKSRDKNQLLTHAVTMYYLEIAIGALLQCTHAQCGSHRASGGRVSPRVQRDPKFSHEWFS